MPKRKPIPPLNLKVETPSLSHKETGRAAAITYALKRIICQATFTAPDLESPLPTSTEKRQKRAEEKRAAARAEAAAARDGANEPDDVEPDNVAVEEQKP